MDGGMLSKHTYYLFIYRAEILSVYLPFCYIMPTPLTRWVLFLIPILLSVYL